MFSMTAGELCTVVNGCLVNGAATTEFKGVSIDSRTLKPGMVFMALKGERFDGHQFIAAALKCGAAAAVGAHFPPEAIEACDQGQVLIKVTDTLVALQDLAAYHRKKEFKGPAIAVTGSSGKTTTKNLIEAVLNSGYKVHKTPGNFNNEIGLPLTLLGLQSKHQALVVEMAMRGRGEISDLCQIARPNIGVITNIGSAHLELLGSVANIAAAKGELLDFLQPSDFAVLNADDQWCRQLGAACNCRVIYYGLKKPADIGAKDISNLGLKGTSFTAVFPQGNFPMQIGAPGIHNVYNALAALAVGYHLGLAPTEMVKTLLCWPQEDLRQEIRPGPGGSLVYNDAYNANPESMQAVLQVLAAFPGRRVAVLGEMFELGPEAISLHEDVGRMAAEIDLYRLVTVGKLAMAIADGALKAGMPTKQVFTCSNHQQAAQHLRELGKGDMVLFKGSRRAGMEKVLALWEAMTDG